MFNRRKYQYHDVGLNPHIENAYHALAIDERRKPFAPNLWRRPANWNGVLEQAWFPGVHSNVGGGYAPDGLANEALHWIAGKAQALGLAVDDDFLKKIDDYRFENRVNTRSEAVRLLIEKGLQSEATPRKQGPPRGKAQS